MADEIKTTTIGTITNQMKEIVELKDGFKEEQVKFIKNLVNEDLSDNELYMFLVVASKAGLNPFNREIVAVVYDKDGKTDMGRRVNYIVTRDGKRAVANKRGGLDSVVTEAIYTKQVKNPSDDKDMITILVQPWEGGTLWGAKSTVTRNGKKFESIVPLKEYNTGKSVWANKPETMIKKVAESQALSQAVPELLGLYDDSEMSSAAQTSTPATPQLPNGDEILKKGDPMLETLNVMGADIATHDWTRQQAADEIARLGTEKGSRKPKVETPKA